MCIFTYAYFQAQRYFHCELYMLLCKLNQKMMSLYNATTQYHGTTI